MSEKLTTAQRMELIICSSRAAHAALEIVEVDEPDLLELRFRNLIELCQCLDLSIDRIKAQQK